MTIRFGARFAIRQAEKALLHAHYWITFLLAVTCLLFLRHLHIPLKFDWVDVASAYWLVLAAQAIFVAAVLYVVGFGPGRALGPLIARWRQQKLRFVCAISFFLVLFWAATWLTALILTVDALASLEYLERMGSDALKRAAVAVLPAAALLFGGFLLVFAWNDVIVSLRYFSARDPMFYAMDRWLLGGSSVSAISHWAIRTFPLSFFRFLEFIYFGMFPQIGAGLLIVSLYAGMKRGLQFVGTILMAYYLALLLFYLWTSQGPYVLCPAHFSRFPESLRAYSIQKNLMVMAQELWNRVPRGRIGFDYFIGFPCMHMAQPLIVMWFLRRWKKMMLALAAYDALLLVAIVFLEWHYVVDILGGVLVAAAAIALTGSYTSGRASARVPSEKLASCG